MYDGVAGIGVDTVVADLPVVLFTDVRCRCEEGGRLPSRVGVDDLVAFAVAAADLLAGFPHISVVEDLLDPKLPVPAD
ncbi:hypothetical protein [Streptomyces kronopolitis]|uniref:hypothetical protein n=1 Tax=Streptomyces kronopolitis TaxID=1612435 RepID=UPI0020BEC585|nr:hypothetical protein [Streptomyces kronopolitis]MCL6296849.1 hypothetical protein [Streptomyces kronopolitis]